MTWEQFAWIKDVSPSETEKNFSRWDITSHKCEGSNFNFFQWLVGFTDGDGCFNVYVNESHKIFTFKISQKNNNLRALHYIKKNLGVGSVVEDKRGMAHFLIRNKKDLIETIIPIFDKFPLLTSKEFSYQQFKKCLNISNDISLSSIEQISLIKKEKSIKCPNNYIPSEWKTKDLPITKSWLIGFIEAEGSFYITSKDSKRLVHCFGITQKNDRIVLEGIKNFLNLSSNVRFNKKGFYSLDVLDTNSLIIIKKTFFSCLVGVKSLDYRIWARSFRNKGDYKKLLKIRELLRKIRKNPTIDIENYED